MKRLLFLLGLGAVAVASGCNRPYYGNGYYGQPYAPAYPGVQGYAPAQPQYAPAAGGCAPVYGAGVQPTYSVPAGTVPANGVPMGAVAPGGLQPIAANPAYAPTYSAPGAAPMY
jgi:hypothetical protein